MEILRIMTSSMVFVASACIMGLLSVHWRAQKYEKNATVLKPPKSVLYISIAITLVIAMVMLLIAILAYGAEAYFSLFCIPFLLMGIWLILYSANWKIEIKEKKIIFQNMFGKKSEYNYDEITQVKRIKIGGYKIYINKKKITVDYWIQGNDNLWDILKVMNFKGNKS